MTTQEYLNLREKELLPCPFCGGEGVLVHVNCDKPDNPQIIQLTCHGEEGCIATDINRDYYTVKQAIEDWNKRAQAEWIKGKE